MHCLIRNTSEDIKHAGLYRSLPKVTRLACCGLILPDLIVHVSCVGGSEIADKHSHISSWEKPFAAIGCPAAHAMSAKGPRGARSMRCSSAETCQQWIMQRAAACPKLHMYSVKRIASRPAVCSHVLHVNSTMLSSPLSCSSLVVTSCVVASTLVSACSWLFRMRTILLRGSEASPGPEQDLELTFSMQALSSRVMLPSSALILSARTYSLSRSVSSSFIWRFSSCSAEHGHFSVVSEHTAFHIALKCKSVGKSSNC